MVSVSTKTELKSSYCIGCYKAVMNSVGEATSLRDNLECVNSLKPINIAQLIDYQQLK